MAIFKSGRIGREYDGRGIVEMKISEMIDLPNQIQNFIDSYQRSNKLVILYGAGVGVSWYIKLMQKYNIPVEAIVDGNRNDDNDFKCIADIPIISFDKCCILYKEVLFVISAPAHAQIISERIQKRIPSSNIFTFDPTLNVLQNRITTDQFRGFVKQNTSGLLEIYNALEDEISRDTMHHIIYGSITNDIRCYEKHVESNIYFPDIVIKRLTEQEVFVDIGAFTGDSIKDFMKAVNHKYKKIFAFEPDGQNILELKRTISGHDIEIIQKGCYSQNQIMYFKNEGGIDESAHLTSKEKSTDSVEVVSLDYAISESISYIKMDVEGVELEVLKGAEELITKYHPKLAISIYHKLEDILEIPQYLLSKYNYKIYMRHQWNCGGTDTVLYCL